MKLELGARATCGSSSGVLFGFRLLAGKHDVSGQWLQPVSNLRNYKHFSLSPILCEFVFTTVSIEHTKQRTCVCIEYRNSESFHSIECTTPNCILWFQLDWSISNVLLGVECSRRWTLNSEFSAYCLVLPFMIKRLVVSFLQAFNVTFINPQITFYELQHSCWPANVSVYGHPTGTGAPL